jgi:hypothetical protein
MIDPITTPPYAGPHTLSEEELSAIYRAKLMFRVLVVIGVTFLVGALAVVAAGVWLIRGTQVHNTQITADTHTAAEQTRETADLIQSCVNPHGDCYERSQKRTGSIVGVLNQYVVLSASCTAHLANNGVVEHTTQTQLTNIITACVVRQLAHRH